MKIHLQTELDRLKKQLFHLSSVVEENLKLAIRAVRESDSELAETVRRNDAEIDDVRFVVDGEPTQIGFDIDDWILKEDSQESYTMNIVVTELPGGDVGEYYEQTVEARGGSTPYAFILDDGDLPDGLALNESTGVISGMPTANGEYSFIIQVTDSSPSPMTDDQNYTIVIGGTTGIDDDNPNVPSDFALLGNYPNPFNASTLIKFRLVDPGDVTLEIFNLMGQKIETIHNGFLTSGEHELSWNGDNVPSGVYFYRLAAGEKSSTKKMTLLK